MVVIEKKRPRRSSSICSIKVTGPRILAIGVLGLQAVVTLQFFLAQSGSIIVGQQNRDNNGIRPTSSSGSTGSEMGRRLVLLSTHQEVSCVAWRATDDCSPHGPLRKHSSALSFFADTDLSCTATVPAYASGYCELQVVTADTTSITIIPAFQQSCYQTSHGREGPLSLWQRYLKPVFSCQQAVAFLNYQEEAHSYRPTIPISTSTSNRDGNSQQQAQPTRGILIQIYPSSLPSVYTIIRLLRDVHHCQLPIELWRVQGELEDHHPLIQHILKHFSGIHLRVIATSSSETINSNSYMSKPYSIAYSQFDQVLFLDSDNFPFQDPTYLFDSLQQQPTRQEDINRNNDRATTTTTTAIFWKDFWNPQRNDFVMTSDSLVWELLGLSNHTIAKEEMEMESGQMVIDRRTSVNALQVLLFLAQTFSQWLEPLALVWGDKDLFRLAWHMTRTPFYYISQPPSLAGQDVVLKWASADQVCGITMVQHDPVGNPIFFHRNIAKLSKEADLFKVWEKGVTFVGTNEKDQYAIEGSRSIYRGHGCYHPKPHVREYFQEIDYRGGSKVELFEETILQFAREGLEISQANNGR